jgi:hypothetical protein
MLARVRRIMNKQTAGLLVLAALAFIICPGTTEAAERQGTVELFLGNYTIQEPLFKTVYEPGGALQGLILSSILFFNFDFYLELKALYKTGQLTYSKEKTTMLLVPVSLGLRYGLPLGFLQPYAGGGLDFYLFYESNPIGSLFNYVRGGHFLVGVYLKFAKNFPILLNFRLKNTWAQTEVNDRKVELGGLEYGGSLVIAF